MQCIIVICAMAECWVAQSVSYLSLIDCHYISAEEILKAEKR